MGRNLSECPTATGACTATRTVGLAEPFSLRENRLSQLDIRLAKTFRLGGNRLQASADIFNLFNANTVLLTNPNYGPQYLRPLEVLPGRFFKLGARYDF